MEGRLGASGADATAGVARARTTGCRTTPYCARRVVRAERLPGIRRFSLCGRAYGDLGRLAGDRAGTAPGARGAGTGVATAGGRDRTAHPRPLAVPAAPVDRGSRRRGAY